MRIVASVMTPSTPSEPTKSRLRSGPALEAGEGLRIPREGVVLGSEHRHAEQPDVLLVVRFPGATK